jgi:hypothetical protein
MESASRLATSDLFGHVPGDPPATRRSRITNNPLSRNSTATATGRRVNDLFLSYLRAMTDRSCTGQADALRAAELMVAAEEARARLLAGNGDADGVVRIENLAARAVRKLGLDRQQGQKPKKTLADYAREKAGASAGGAA